MKRCVWFLVAGAFCVWVGGLSPAHACDCGIWTREQAINRAPGAFVGRVVATRRVTAADAAPTSSFSPVFISRVKVLYRLHGPPIADEVEIFSGISEKTSCGDFGLDNAEGQSFIFLDEVTPDRPGSIGPCVMFGVED